MKCPDEFILSQYADGELPGSETMELAAHLETCRDCRDLVASLKAESRLLVESLQGIDMCEPERAAVQREQPELSGIDRLAAISIGVVILLRAGIGFMQDIELPLALQWLHPLSLSGLINWLVNGLFYIIEEGEGVMTSLAKAAGYAILGFLILGASVVVTRRAMRTKAILGLVSLILLFVVPGYALDVRKAENRLGSVTVASGETVDDTLVVFANSVNINGTISGDLIAFARQVNVQGNVQGNVIVFGQKLDFSGSVDGDIFAFGQNILAEGRIGQSLWAFGQTITVGRDVRLDKDATLFSQWAFINGNVERDVTAYSQTLDVGSKVGRNLHFEGGALMIHAPSVIGGNLYSMTISEKEVQIDPAVTIGGKKHIGFIKPQASRYRTPGFYAKQAFRIGAGFFMGLLLYWIVPGMRHISLSTGRALLTSGGIGFLVGVAAPVAAIILAITLIGIPIALLVTVLWLLGLYLAKIIVAKCIGSAIFGARDNGLSSTLLPLLIGLVIVIIAVNLPYIGGILNFILMLIGFGALVMTVYRMRPAGASQN
jgi:hypothetical protein